MNLLTVFFGPRRRASSGGRGAWKQTLAPILALLLVAGIGLALGSCTSSGGAGSIYGGLGLPSDTVPFMGDARTGTLPNGLRYYILKNSRPENRAFLALAVRAGSIMEQEHERGLAHFVEHMGFNGTARFPEADLRNYLRSLGMRFGADLNAYTSFEETVYSLETPVETDPSGTKRIPARALAILDDWTYAVTFDPGEVESERSIIMEEYRSRLGAGDRISRQLLPALLRGSIYAERRPIGLPEIIETAPAERLVDFYRTWYRPDNMAVIMVGDFDDGALEAELSAHFNAPAPAIPPPEPPGTELPPPERNRLQIQVITDPEYPFLQITAYYKSPPQARRQDLSGYREELVRNLADRIIARRFDEAANEPDAPYTAAGAWEERWGRTGRFYAFAAISKPGNARETLRALMREKESITRYGFTASEIDAAKRFLLSDLRRGLSERDRQNSSDYLSLFQDQFLRNTTAPDIEWELLAAETLLPGIGRRELAAAIRSLLAAGDLTLTVVAPELESPNLPDEAEIRRILRESSRARIPRPRERTVAGELVDMMPEPGTIDAVAEEPGTGALTLTLSNGATVIIQNSANKNNEIIFYAISRGGASALSPEEAVSARLTPEISQASGIGPYTRAALTDILAGKQVSFSFWSSWFHRGYEGSSTREDLQTLFELLWLSFTQIRIDDDAARVVADQYRTRLARQMESPEQVFSNEITRIMYGNNPWIRPMTLEDADRIDATAAWLYLRRASNPSDYTFIFTGNVDLGLLQPYLETWLASIPPLFPWNEYTDPGVIRPLKLDHKVYKGREELSRVFMAWFKPEEFSLARRAAAEVLTEYLDILLTETIRERLGGVYSVYAEAGLSSFPPPGEAVLQCAFGCSPDRAMELSEAIVRELEGIARGNIDRDIFGKAVDALETAWVESMQSNRYISTNYGELAVILNLPTNSLMSFPARYRAVTAGDVQSLCRDLLPRGPVRIILYPETAAE